MVISIITIRPDSKSVSIYNEIIFRRNSDYIIYNNWWKLIVFYIIYRLHEINTTVGYPLIKSLLHRRRSYNILYRYFIIFDEKDLKNITPTLNLTGSFSLIKAKIT